MKRFAVMAVALLALATPAAAATFTFPSAGSTVVGSVGFINADEIGYFWSAARGDSVEETFADPALSVDSLALALNVVTNVLASGAEVDWNVLLNNILVGSFTVTDGFTGDLNLLFSFAPISSPGSYTLRLEVTNEVPSGDGSHTFAYDGAFQHSVTFNPSVPEPATVLLLSSALVGLAASRRRAARRH
jgi:opacity protein-like surface antigen